MQFKSFLFIELTNLLKKFFSFQLHIHQLFSQIKLIFGLKINRITKFFKLFSLIPKNFFVVGLNFSFIELQIQFFHQLLVLVLIKVLIFFKFPLEFFFFGMQLQLSNIILPLHLSQFLFISIFFLIKPVYCLLIGPFHLSNQFNSNHFLVKIGYHFYLKILQLDLFLLDEQLELLNLG